MDSTLLAVQARIFLATGLGWLGFGLWQGYDPLTVSWRAAAGALAALVVARWLLRIAADTINERVASDLAERELAAATRVATPPAERKR